MFLDLTSFIPIQREQQTTANKLFQFLFSLIELTTRQQKSGEEKINEI
jgi:hypothetical protein